MRKLLHKLVRAVRGDAIPPCDAPTIAVLEAVLRPTSNTIDIGCNRGSILRENVRIAPGGRHFAFEPIPRLFEMLRRRFPTVECHRLALSDEKGTARFNYFPDWDGFSGLMKREIAGVEGRVQEIEVGTDRLDDVLPEGITIDLIKIDVEGAELKVLRGAEGTIRRCRPVIIFECGKGGLDLYGFKPEDVFGFLEDCGLTMRKLTGWSRDDEPLSRQAFADEFWAGGEYMFVASPTVVARV